MAFLTMRSSPQLVATHGNGFGLFLPLPREPDLRLIATGCAPLPSPALTGSGWSCRTA